MNRQTTPTSPVISIFALAAALALFAGCQTASVEDLAPSAALNEPAETVPLPAPAPQQNTVAKAEAMPAPAAPAGETPKNTGEYPKFGRMPVAETTQLGPQGTAALRGGLAAARASQSTGAASPESYAEKMRRLRLLGLQHGNEALQEIEAP